MAVVFEEVREIVSVNDSVIVSINVLECSIVVEVISDLEVSFEGVQFSN